MRFAALLSLTVALPLLAGCGASGEEAENQKNVASAGPPRQQPLPVEALTVTRGQLIERIEASGTVAGIREARVVSETQGIVEDVRFELGDYVEKGEVLVQVDDEVARLNMEQAKGEMESARVDYRTKQNLLEKGGASKAEVARAESALRGAEARYRQAVKAYEDCSISSPISGSVAAKEPAASLGNYLNPGMQVARITDLSRLRLEISLGEGVIGLVKPGAEAQVTVPAACDTVMEAKVTAVAAGSTRSTGSYTAVVEWENRCSDSIKSGMSAKARIEPVQQEPMLIIPSSAVTTRGGEQVVFLAQEGEAVMQPVETGRIEGNLAAIRAGLEGGETLIISGLSGLSEEDPVNPTVIGESGDWK